MSEFHTMRSAYGDLRNAINSELLVQDMLSLANHPYHDWNLTLSPKEVSTDVHSVVSAFDLLYRKKAYSENKYHYVSKGIGSFSYIDQLRAELPNAKFIHMVRDPRDQVASWMKKPIHLFTPYDAVQHWVKEQDLYLDALWSKNLDCVSIKYEDLISEPQSTMEKVFAYLKIPAEPQCFSTNKTNKESQRNPHWENLAKPILSNNSNKFLSELSQEEVAIVESVAKKQMQIFSYEFTTSANWQPDQRFFENNNEIRIYRKSQINQAPDTARGQLHDKFNLLERIRNSRGFSPTWNKTQASSNNLHSSNTSGDIIKKLTINRLKYLLMAIIGQRLTNKVLKSK